MKQLSVLKHIVSLATVLALFVVMLGAYTRLTDAGLGCPDWPGCYGHLVLPQNQQALDEAGQHFKVQTIEPRKAWTEMVHRYAAGTLGLLILVIAVLALKFRRMCQTPLVLPLILPLLVIFQALLGMWTVTLKLLPLVVMAHLLGGMLIFALLVCCRVQLSSQPLIEDQLSYQWRWAAIIGLVLLFCQIALGGWVSANYAGIACVGFPRCNGQWLPTLHMAKGFYLLSPVGANYQGGMLDVGVRVTIQFIHRLGAFLVFTFLFLFAVVLIKQFQTKCVAKVQILAVVLMLLLMLQFVLGIINVTYILPLFVAVAHNGVAALLLGLQVVLVYFLSGRTHGAN